MNNAGDAAGLGTRLYWVRHGENVANLTKEFSSRRVDYSLTPKGVLQAQQTAEYFRDKAIHAIYCSTLKRARETAAAIGTVLGLPVAALDEFREIDVGDLELQPPSDENWAFHNRVFLAWLRGDRDAGFPGGEDYHMLLARMRAGYARVLAGRAGQNLVVVGHGGSFMATLREIAPAFDLFVHLRVGAGNCSITELRLALRDGHPEAEVLTWASLAHLHGEAAEQVTPVPKRAVEDFAKAK